MHITPDLCIHLGGGPRFVHTIPRICMHIPLVLGRIVHTLVCVCTTLVVTDPERCPGCGEVYEVISWAQPALVRHGGYGFTEAHRVRACRCAHTIHDTSAEAPDRRTRP